MIIELLTPEERIVMSRFVDTVEHVRQVVQAKCLDEGKRGRADFLALLKQVETCQQTFTCLRVMIDQADDVEKLSRLESEVARLRTRVSHHDRVLS